ncbi:hypothetical protein GJ629_05045 [Halapricum sp. CBA1109]|uniref:hypothetical protein n=1 Tax=Halapricum sp. CBA1109 TaxID=2668068 RepID=UPI0012FC5FF6|nr:hypothetical protein [Halapricum sp. CBA1109]MUV89345.1 hypothetical protein [Halapricum sp. CBA1109]
MPSYEELRSVVVDSAFDEWIRFGRLGTWTYQQDVALRLVQQEQLGPAQEPWATQFQAPSTRYGYVFYYGNSPIEYHTVVGLDNDRAFVPEPQQAPDGSLSITPYQRLVGEIITGDPGSVESYCNRAGIAVSQ